MNAVCTCPPNPVNELDNCDACTAEFNRLYSEPDGYANDKDRSEAEQGRAS